MKNNFFKQEKLFKKGENIRRFLYKFSKNSLSIMGLIAICIILFCAMFAPFISPCPESAGKFVNFSEAKQPPSLIHLCGTDMVGRDILTRILFGFRYSLKMASFVLLLVVPSGVFLGMIAGYYRGGILDLVIMRITDIFLALPGLLLALVVCSILTPSAIHAMMAVSISWWPWYTRLLYGITSSYNNKFFVQSARLTGASDMYIIFREILPNCLGPIFTKISLDVGWIILISSSLSFLGLGAQAPTPDLGTMVADGSKYLPSVWWISIFPAIAIMLIVLAFNIFGDGIRDVFGVERG